MENKNNQNLPADIAKAIESSDVYDKLEKIADKYGLLIDQLGSLNMYTEQLMVGKLKSTMFVSTISKELEISSQTAEKIAVDINNDILLALKDSLRKMQEQAEAMPQPTPAPRPVYTPPPMSPPKPAEPLPTTGPAFSVIQRPPSSSSLYKDENLKKEDVLNDLENIQKLKPENAESFVEHLLSNPVANPVQVEVKKKVVEPVVVRKSGVDPYREQI